VTELAPLPDLGTYTVVCGTSVRKPLNVLVPYLASLDWQDLPRGVKLVPYFIADYPAPDDALSYLTEWATSRGGKVESAPTAVGDYSDTGDTHSWAPSAMARVGRNKNRILAYARAIKADAVWLCDADLICDRTTFRSLWDSEQSIACAVYWTYWHRPGLMSGQLHAAPQVWLTHPYNLAGRGVEEWEFRDSLIKRQLTQVWGQGACTLIRKDVLQAGIDFSYLPDVPQEGMMAGEDRHFCISAERKHKAMWADAWPDIFHVYHPDDQQRIPEMLVRLRQEHPVTPRHGDLVSLKLTAVEPVPTGPTQMQYIPTQHIRGRLGGLQLLPEIEEAVATMVRGESAVIPVHFPVSYPVPYFRGRKRLIRVALVDCKPFGFAPVLEQEMFVGNHSGAWSDQTALTPQQAESIANG
jgi:hypothetical protein